MGSLDGRVAAITGAGRGIGREHALLFAAEGAKVVVNDLGGSGDGSGSDSGPAHDVVAEIEAAGGEAVAHTDDISTWAGAESLVATAVDAYGRLDVLVNNAGILRDAFIASMTEEQWDALYRENLHHVFLCTRVVAPHMLERGAGGSIVNVSSIEAFRAVPGCSIYGTFKHAITGFTRTLAVELGPHGIRVNAVAPETTDTLQVRTGSSAAVASTSCRTGRPWVASACPTTRRGRCCSWPPTCRRGPPVRRCTSTAARSRPPVGTGFPTRSDGATRRRWNHRVCDGYATTPLTFKSITESQSRPSSSVRIWSPCSLKSGDLPGMDACSSNCTGVETSRYL